MRLESALPLTSEFQGEPGRTAVIAGRRMT